VGISDNDKVTLAALKAALIVKPIDQAIMRQGVEKVRQINKHTRRMSRNMMILAFARHRFTNYDDLLKGVYFEKEKVSKRFRRYVNMCIEPLVIDWLNKSPSLDANEGVRRKYPDQYKTLGDQWDMESFVE